VVRVVNQIDCPEDFKVGVGMVDISTLLTSSSTAVNYVLKEGVVPGQENSTGTVVTTSTTGQFNLATTLVPPLAVIIQDLANCGQEHILTIGEDCRNTPPCPKLVNASIDKHTICPEEAFILTIDGELSTDLMNGSQIDWYFINNCFKYNCYRSKLPRGWRKYFYF